MTVAIKLIAAYLLSQITDFRQYYNHQPYSFNLLRSLRGAGLFLLLASVFCLPELAGWQSGAWINDGSGGFAGSCRNEWKCGLPVGTIVLLIVTGALIRLVLGGLLFGSLRTWYLLLIAEAVQLGLLGGLVSLHIQRPSLGISLFDLWSSPRFFGLIAIYVISVGLGGVIVPMATSRLGNKTDCSGEDDSLCGAGRSIGMLERLIITTLIIYLPRFDTAAIGLIFAAKSIARFPEFKKTSFAEYYLVGSLTSISVAIFAGLMARYYLP